MHGGPTQTETFDPKMTAPSGVRSVTGEVSTSIPGVTFGATATFASVKLPQVFHAVEATEEGRVEDVAAVNELTWNTFHNHLILPKYEGDLGAPNVFMPIDEAVCRRKVDTIVEAFATQQSRAWFDADTFWALLRIRGVECNSPSRFAEGLYGRKLTLTAAAGGALAAAPDLASVTADVT